MSHSSSKSSDNDLADEIPKRPEFTLIDDRDGREKHTHFSTGFQERVETIFVNNSTKRQMHQGKNSLRFISFLGVIFGAFICIGALFWAIFSTLFAAIELLQNKTQNQSMLKSWKFVITMAVITIGCTLGIFYPPLGLGFIAFYYSFHS